MADTKSTNNPISENNMEDIIMNSSETQKQSKTNNNIPPQETKITNLDDVIEPENKEIEIKEAKNNQIKSNNDDEIKYTSHEESERDIFEEEDEKKEKKWLASLSIVLIIIAILLLALRQIIKNKPNISNLFNNWSGSTQTWTIQSWNIKSWINNNEVDNLPQKDNQFTEKEQFDEFYNNDKNWNIYYEDGIIPNTDKTSFKALGHKYAKDKNNVYYEGKVIPNAQSDEFHAIDTKGVYELDGIIVTSSHLLEHLKEKSNREFLMTTIADVTNQNINVKEELKIASIYSMNTFKNDYDTLNKLQRGDEISDIQKAEFGVIFLYIKIIKSLESDKIRMSMAKEELKYFIENSDKILKEYGTETPKPNTIKWNLGYDEYCIYNNWKLFWCFLNKIFITKK